MTIISSILGVFNLQFVHPDQCSIASCVREFVSKYLIMIIVFFRLFREIVCVFYHDVLCFRTGGQKTRKKTIKEK